MIIIVLILLGLILGSFVNALVWRLHEQSKSTSKKARAQLSIFRGRSMCPQCHHQLVAKDLVPVFSWLALHGKCRYCRKSISSQYPIVELGTAGLFIFSYNYWPLGFRGAGLLQFILWLGFLTGFVALAAYDARWMLIPNKLLYPLIVVAMAQVIVVSVWDKNITIVWAAAWGVLILCGLFYTLFYVSDGQWIGGGDVKLGVLLGLLVGGPFASILLIFFASLGGTLWALPLLMQGKAKSTTRVPFGPFLLLAAIAVLLLGAHIKAWGKIHYF